MLSQGVAVVAVSLTPFKIAFLVSKNYNRHVKHLIRNTKSLQYFNHGHWTADARDAQTFRTSEAALETSARCGLSNTELVIRPRIDPSQTIEASSPVATMHLSKTN